MTDAARNDVLQRLNSTLERAKLPERLRTSGAALAERLGSPIRLAFLGQPGSGKTTLIRALLGPDLPSLNGNAPTHELSYGDALQARITLEDGTQHNYDLDCLNTLLTADPIFIEIYSPNECLRSLRILEVVTDGSPEEMSAAAKWAAHRCEIPIWCTQGFDTFEAHVWDQVPTAKKNHAMLVITQADTVSPDVLSARLDEAYATQGTGFGIIAPVAARHALKAQVAERPDTKKIETATGIDALRAEIFRRVKQGQQADIDHAEIFLSRFEKPKERKLSRPAPDLAAMTDVPPNASGCLKDGAKYVEKQAQEMLFDIEEFGAFAPRKIVERCLETANSLVDMLADDDPKNEAEVLAHDAASDAADMLLLMTLENTDGAAEDAVNLMLQIKRDFELAA